MKFDEENITPEWDAWTGSVPASGNVTGAAEMIFNNNRTSALLGEVESDEARLERCR
jgi:hypothetical protein